MNTTKEQNVWEDQNYIEQEKNCLGNLEKEPKGSMKTIKNQNKSENENITTRQKTKEYNRIYYIKNRSKIIKKKTEYWRNNKDKINLYKRKYSKVYRKTPKQREYDREYRKTLTYKTYHKKYDKEYRNTEVRKRWNKKYQHSEKRKTYKKIIIENIQKTEENLI